MRIVLLWIVMLCSGCAQLTPLDVFVIGISPADSGPLEQRVRVALRIQNPNDAPVMATGMSIQLDLNGQRLARGVSDAAFTVPRLGETTTSIIASTSLFDVAKQLIAMPGRQSMNYVLRGEVYRAGLSGSIKFHRDGTLSAINPPTPVR